jgi:biopolymer transport protein ExbD
MARRRANEGVTEVVEFGLQFTPMIDCIFQLIIFFMVNVKFRTMEGLLKAFLPRADSSVPTVVDPNKNPIIISITEPSAGMLVVAVNNKAVGGTTEKEQYAALEQWLKVTQKKFEQEIKEKMPPVIINAHARIPYKYVIYALNVCGKLKLEDVMFMFPTE